MKSITLICLLATASLALCGPADKLLEKGTHERGLTMRLYEIWEIMDGLYPLVPGQTPNVDEKRDVIDWNGAEDFSGHNRRFIVESFADLVVETAGGYHFRLSATGGTHLSLNDETVIEHHKGGEAKGSIELSAGLHSLMIRAFHNQGGARLKLEWQGPGETEFTTVPATAFITPAGVTRVVNPDKKNIIRPDDGTRPGKGQPLDGVHPSWTLATVRPADFHPKVGAMAFHPDGRLFVATFDPNQDATTGPLPVADGKIWALTGVNGDDPVAYTATEVASGLWEPLGMTFVEGQLHISQRLAVTRLEDSNGDGYYDTKTDIGGGWLSDNYHHFHFGLLARDGYTYSTLSTSISPRHSGLNGPNPPNRGTLVRTRLADGEVSFLLGGLRTPNGIGFGPENEIFGTDNQGAWMPTSRLNHYVPGRFYGHINNPADGGSPSLFANQEETPPAIWFPQNVVANSPSEPILIPEGIPFAGDMLVGDITLGGINRVSLEKVGGVWQGAVYRFTQGIEAGVNRLLWGDDGSLYIGCIGATGNWSHYGKLTGLQRLRLNPEAPVTFEIANISATSKGFTITYTKPVPSAFLSDPANFSGEQWTYKSAPGYGGPREDVTKLQVATATPSADRTQVTLEIPGLKKSYVVHLLADPVADDGSQIHAAEAWYTLNEIPGEG